MSTPDIDVKALAGLARISVSEDEAVALEGEVRSILSFVEAIQDVSLDAEGKEDGLRNVMRGDTDAYEGRQWSEALLDAAPKKRGKHLSVKQVLSHVKKDASRGTNA